MDMLPLFARCVFAAGANHKRAAGENLLADVISLKGVIALYEVPKHAKGLLRGGAAFLLALLLCAGAPAKAAEVSGVFSNESARMLVPVGHTVGIKLFSRGVVVVKLTDGGTPARNCGLRTGDVIVECGGAAVTSTEQFQSLLQENGDSETDLQVRRNGGSMTLSVAPTQNDQGVYCIGAWIRDSMAGIGTVTFYDPSTGAFGALGHGINDVDTAQLMPLESGSIMYSEVAHVKKGVSGEPGELQGAFEVDRDLGELYANTDRGVFGVMEDFDFAGSAVPVAAPGEVRTGGAVIRANVSGDGVEEYAIEITRVLEQTGVQNLLLRVTDQRLIDQTGGIVQGMSGSPILQDGKLVGAVTHVFVQDSTKGFGVFIENMLEHVNL